MPKQQGITPDERGGFHTYVSLGTDKDGKRIRRHIRGATQKEVAEERTRLLRRSEQGLAPAGRPLTLETYLRQWLSAVEGRELAYKTLVGYRYAVQAVIPFLGSARMDKGKPTTKDIENLATHLRQNGNAAGRGKPMRRASVRSVIRSLSVALNEAVADGVLARNPVAGARLPANKPDEEVQPLTQTEVAHIMSALRGRPEETRWAVALSLALRQGEILGLRWSALDLDSGKAFISRAVERRNWQHGCGEPETCGLNFRPSYRAAKCPQRHSGGLVLKSTKGEENDRIPLSPQLVVLLRAHRKDQLAQRIRAGGMWEDHDLVFCTETGKPIDPRRDWVAWGAMLTEIGVRHVGTHVARHTAITLALQAGIDDLLVSRRLARHRAGVAFTRQKYQHLVADQHAAMAQQMGDLILGQGS